MQNALIECFRSVVARAEQTVDTERILANSANQKCCERSNSDAG